MTMAESKHPRPSRSTALASTAMSKFEKELQIKPVADQPDTFTNASPLWVVNGTRGIAGSLLLAHSTTAAYRTVPDNFTVDSMQTQFLAVGELRQPVTYHVERVQSGRTFAVRVVRAKQDDLLLALINVGFMKTQQADFPSLEYVVAPVIEMTPPKKDENDVTLFRTEKGPWVVSQRLHINTSGPPSSRIAGHWFRAEGESLSSERANHAALMYFSDLVILDVPARLFDLNIGLPVPGDPIQGPDKTPDLEFMSSLNHVVHVHDLRGFQANEWIFVEVDSPWASGGRSVGKSRIFTGNGKLIATCVQEGYIKLKKGVRERLSEKSKL